MASQTDARFSTYSGAPSLQPSLTSTLDTSNNQSARTSQATNTFLAPHSMSEKGQRQVYGSKDTTAQTSTTTLNSSDPKAADIKSWSGALERMQDERLDKQRYVMSGNKSDEVSASSLGAKVERALARRMVGQDASFPKKKRLGEKRSVEVEAN